MGRRGKILGVVAFALTFGIGGCTEPFDAPPAYDSEHVICDDAPKWNAVVRDCRQAFEANGSCVGFVAFNGRLQGQRIAVEGALHHVSIGEAASGDVLPYFSGFRADGNSPYFNYQLELKEVGGTIDKKSVDQRRFSLREGSDPTTRYVDEFAELSLRLANESESTTFRATHGEISFSVPHIESAMGRFSGQFGYAGERIDGCFVVFGVPDADDPKE